MTTNEIQNLISRDPFQPFRIQLSSGAAYDVRNPDTVVAMKRELFLALSDGERWVFIPYIHVAAIEAIGNGEH